MIIGVSVTKSIPNFRGRTEEFSNVYHYDTDIGYTAEALLDDVVDLERSRVFQGNVRFVRAKAWGPTDQGIEASEMLVQKDLQGVGANSAIGGGGAQMYPELAIVISWPTGRKDSRGNPIFLRKYYHTMYYGGGGGAANGTEPFAESFRQSMVDSANAFKNVGAGADGAGHLCNQFGDRLPLGTDPECLPYPHIRQFRG